MSGIHLDRTYTPVTIVDLLNQQTEATAFGRTKLTQKVGGSFEGLQTRLGINRNTGVLVDLIKKETGLNDLQAATVLSALRHTQLASVARLAATEQAIPPSMTYLLQSLNPTGAYDYVAATLAYLHTIAKISGGRQQAEIFQAYSDSFVYETGGEMGRSFASPTPDYAALFTDVGARFNLCIMEPLGIGWKSEGNHNG